MTESKKSLHWFPFFLGALLLTSVGANVFLVVRGHDDPAFAVEPDYYDKAVHWDERQAARRASDELGWRIEVDASRDGVQIELADALGRPVEGAQVEVEAFHNARASQRLRARLAPEAPGRYVLARRFERPGLWELRLSAIRDGDRFLHTAREELR